MALLANHHRHCCWLHWPCLLLSFNDSISRRSRSYCGFDRYPSIVINVHHWTPTSSFCCQRPLWLFVAPIVLLLGNIACSGLLVVQKSTPVVVPVATGLSVLCYSGRRSAVSSICLWYQSFRHVAIVQLYRGGGETSLLFVVWVVGLPDSHHSKCGFSLHLFVLWGSINPLLYYRIFIFHRRLLRVFRSNGSSDTALIVLENPPFIDAGDPSVHCSSSIGAGDPSAHSCYLACCCSPTGDTSVWLIELLLMVPETPPCTPVVAPVKPSVCLSCGMAR
jgi:hypothetical protein